MSQTKDHLDSNNHDMRALAWCIIDDAISRSASDIHIEPWEDGEANIRLRIGGKLESLESFPRPLNIKMLAGAITGIAGTSYTSHLPVDGHIEPRPLHPNVALRLSMFPVIGGFEKIVVRIFDSKAQKFDLEELDYEPDTLDKLKNLLDSRQGLLLLAGPTGSGKTTAIYSALSHLMRKSKNAMSISTIEDPIEFKIPYISQSEVNDRREFTFERALRSLLRQDPEVIMIGEIRDTETAKIAVRASQTGHLVISTVHSGNAVGAFLRLKNIGVDPYLLAAGVIGVLALRLFRRNCDRCLEPYHIETSQLGFPAGTTCYRSTGKGAFEDTFCPVCHGARYQRMSGLTEILVAEKLGETQLAKLVEDGDLAAFEKAARDHGMKTLRENGRERVIAKSASCEEIFRVLGNSGL